MMRRLLIIALAGLSACEPEQQASTEGKAWPVPAGDGGSGGSDLPGGGWGGQDGAPEAGPAADYFVANVHPALAPTCAKCHVGGAFNAPRWLAADPVEAYARIHAYGGGALVAPASSNLLLYKGAHQGPAITGIQAGIVKKWLALEHPDQGAPPQAETLASALERFSACMDFGEWQLRELDEIADVPTSGGCSCATCHSDGTNAGGLHLSDDDELTFQLAGEFPGIMKLVTGSVTPTGAFAGLVPAERIADKGSESVGCNCNDVLGLSPLQAGYCHPSYAVSGELRDNIEKFVELTILFAEREDCAIARP